MADSLSDRFKAVTDAFASGDFDASGANATYAFDAPLPALPAISSTFAPSATSRGAVVTSSGGAPSTGGSVAGAGAVAINGTAAAPSNATATATAGAGTSGSIADYFLRAVIIILGFIFVAVGLNMFRPGIVPNPVKAIR